MVVLIVLKNQVMSLVPPAIAEKGSKSIRKFGMLYRYYIR